MNEQQPPVDRLLGYGGIAIVIVAIAVTIATIQSNDSTGFGWLEMVAGTVAAVALVWMIAITVRHYRLYSKAGGRDLIIASWVAIPVITGLVVVLGGISSGDDDIGEWFSELLGSPRPYVVLLAVPLFMASVAILIDAIDRGTREQGKVQGTLGWHQRPVR